MSLLDEIAEAETKLAMLMRQRPLGSLVSSHLTAALRVSGR